MKYLHKVICLVDDEELAMVIDTEECPSLMDALAELMFVHKIDEVYFAGTCPEDEIEYFGNDAIEWEIDEAPELALVTTSGDDDIIH